MLSPLSQNTNTQTQRSTSSPLREEEPDGQVVDSVYRRQFQSVDVTPHNPIYAALGLVPRFRKAPRVLFIRALLVIKARPATAAPLTLSNQIATTTATSATSAIGKRCDGKCCSTAYRSVLASTAKTAAEGWARRNRNTNNRAMVIDTLYARALLHVSLQPCLQ
jgi:hypothetical protein